MSQALQIEASKQTEMEKNSGKFLTQCQELEVVDADGYRYADDLISRGMTIKKTIAQVFAAPKKAAHDAHKAIVKTEKSLIDPIEKGTRLLGNRMATWKREEDRKRREKEEAERRRVEEEKKKIEDEAKKNNLPAPVHEPELPPAVAVDTTPDVNTSFRIDFDIEITDPALVPDQYKEIKENWILADVRRFKGKRPIPGVKIIEKEIPIRKAG